MVRPLVRRSTASGDSGSSKQTKPATRAPDAVFSYPHARLAVDGDGERNRGRDRNPKADVALVVHAFTRAHKYTSHYKVQVPGTARTR